MKKYILLLFLYIPVLLFSQNEDYIVSTKNIEEKQDNVILTEEQKFIKENFPFIPLCELSKGDKFTTTDILRSFIFVLKEKNSTEVIPKNEKNNKVFYFEGIDTVRVSLSIPGTFKTLLHFNFVSSDSISYYYEYTKSINDACNPENKLYGLIFLNDVDKARNLLIGKTLYINENMRKTGNDDLYFGKKYVPVKIVNIGICEDKIGLYKFIFTDGDSKEYYVNCRLSGTNDYMEDYELSIYSHSNPTFDKMFSFKDPKLKYPQISNINWKLIQKGEIKIGMTKLECELSYGYPDRVNETNNKYGKSEQWVYEYSIGSKVYLYFRNGRLTSIQD